MEFVAHYREKDRSIQTVEDHLLSVSDICAKLAAKINLMDAGSILGLLHDVGKHSSAFQDYIKTSTGIDDQDGDIGDASSMRGKIDHSTAGSQWIWRLFSDFGPQGKLVGQILATCLASHHGGLLDCLKPDGTNGFEARISKEDERTHLEECLHKATPQIVEKIECLANKNFVSNFCSKLASLTKDKSKIVKHFYLGFLTRFLFSCLIDADRIDSADFEFPGNKTVRLTAPIDWTIPIRRLEEHLQTLTPTDQIDEIRLDVSEQCLAKASSPQGLFTLTVPTGGGKTLSSFRFALNHANIHKLDHIIYIIPFTSIIEQNADIARTIFEHQNDPCPWILEHHSNLEPELQTWRTKLIAQNWDAPIIFTTMVQFLETMFGGGTRGVRRLHNIANSVLVFDEIQSLPINCVHLFCNALQFFVENTKTSAVLCTATQPLLDHLRNSEKGQLEFSQDREIAQNVDHLFSELKRVNIVNKTRAEMWNVEQLRELAFGRVNEHGNCLVVVNTKKWARQLFEACSNDKERVGLFHLSTSMCPAHRSIVLNEVKQALRNNAPVICISTQLIEAGVDIDFNSVIRSLAGLDSIAQAAGRCNRNGRHPCADVIVVNLMDENIGMLTDIKMGRKSAQRVFSELRSKPCVDFLAPEIIGKYFDYYQHDQAYRMAYPLSARQIGRTDTLLNLLSANDKNIGRDTLRTLKLQQSFKTAGIVFKAIDAPTNSVIVPYQRGREIIAALCASFEPSSAFNLLREAQRYSVNVFPNIWSKLIKANAVRAVQEDEAIFYLDERFYSNDFGLSTEFQEEQKLELQIL